MVWTAIYTAEFGFPVSDSFLAAELFLHRKSCLCFVSLL